MRGGGGGGRRLQVPLLLSVLMVCLRCQKIVQSIEGEDVILSPIVNGSLTEIIWKKNDNKVAESWQDAPFFFSDLKGRATLNLTSGNLIIKKVLQKDHGIYKAEALVGAKYQPTIVSLEVFAHLEEPELNCSIKDGNNVIWVNCMPVKQYPMPLSYHWQYDSTEKNTLHGQSLELQTGTNLPENVTCIIVISKSTANKSISIKGCGQGDCCFQERRTHTVTIVLLVVVAVLIIFAVLVLWKRGCLKNTRKQDPDVTETQPLNLCAEDNKAGEDPRTPPNQEREPVSEPKLSSPENLPENREDVSESTGAPPAEEEVKLFNKESPESGLTDNLEENIRGVDGTRLAAAVQDTSGNTASTAAFSASSSTGIFEGPEEGELSSGPRPKLDSKDLEEKRKEGISESPDEGELSTGRRPKLDSEDLEEKWRKGMSEGPGAPPTEKEIESLTKERPESDTSEDPSNGPRNELDSSEKFVESNSEAPTREG
ncbi:uncharacterized protein LOC128341931 isoform X2 [Hemicordylus capensis]|uniref:uncharacterized protein LOC128341931 isoform X2 n=1 Tax=Hemicordylus capensis TaxID=884348 RepID=UPI002302F453|nr:uncharacterized protein LOC128341931 isoform X2 [Hemicordylus capensis]